MKAMRSELAGELLRLDAAVERKKKELKKLKKSDVVEKVIEGVLPEFSKEVEKFIQQKTETLEAENRRLNMIIEYLTVQVEQLKKPMKRMQKKMKDIEERELATARRIVEDPDMPNVGFGAPLSSGSRHKKW